MKELDFISFTPGGRNYLGNYPWGIIPWGIIPRGIPRGSLGAPEGLPITLGKHKASQGLAM